MLHGLVVVKKCVSDSDGFCSVLWNPYCWLSHCIHIAGWSRQAPVGTVQRQSCGAHAVQHVRYCQQGVWFQLVCMVHIFF